VSEHNLRLFHRSSFKNASTSSQHRGNFPEVGGIEASRNTHP
jgi:hypothetical protein